MNTKRLEINGLGFHLIDEGEGEPVLLLHGFPDTSALWRNQIPALVEAGYRAIAPDLRGRGETDAPPNVDDYSLPIILMDLAGILDALGVEKANVVGHDWGAAVAWTFASFNPARVQRLVAISVGHPLAFGEGTIEQLAKSWYMWLYQFPGVAEELFTRDGMRLFRDWAGVSPDIEQYVESLSRPGRFVAGLNWYRANIRPEMLIGTPPEFPPITAPTLGIWSTGDFALTERQMTSSEKYVSAPWRYERIEDCNHWVPLQKPAELNNLLLEFLKS